MIDFVDNQINAATGTLSIRGKFPNANGDLLPGMFVRMQVPTSGETEALLITDRAVSSDQGQKFVYVFAGGKVDERPVTLGPVVDGLRVVTGGLKPEDEVVVVGLMKVRPGSPAKTQEGSMEKFASNVCWRPPSQREATRGPSPDQPPASLAASRDSRPTMKFAHFFISRPIFAIVVSLVLLILGGLAYSTLPVASFPEIAPPTVVVTAVYPGANPQTLADTVATPIEEQVNGVEDMLYMNSQSASDGTMTLTITFKLGTNLDVAQVLVQNRVAIATPQLPEDVRNIGVTVQKQSPNIMLVVNLISPRAASTTRSTWRTTPCSRSRRSSSASRAWATCRSSARASIPCACG